MLLVKARLFERYNAVKSFGAGHSPQRKVLCAIHLNLGHRTLARTPRIRTIGARVAAPMYCCDARWRELRKLPSLGFTQMAFTANPKLSRVDGIFNA